jgi:hypothetical protein
LLRSFRGVMSMGGLDSFGAVFGRTERCREMGCAATRLTRLRDPGEDMAVEGAGLVPGGEEEGGR